MRRDNLVFADLLKAAAAKAGVPYCDHRDTLPRHATKRYGYRSPEAILSVCYHHQGGDPRVGPVVDGSAYTEAVYAIARYHSGPDSHLSPRGAPGIAYTLVVDPSGGIHFCNDIETRTWSQGYRGRPGDENKTWMGVLFMGNMVSQGNPSGHAPTDAQLKMAKTLWDDVFAPFGLDASEATTHNRLGKPNCPGDHLTSVINEIRSQEKPTEISDRLNTVENRQRALNLVLDIAPLLIDGVAGPKTVAAIRIFQRLVGLVQDGVWGRNTERKMRGKLNRA